MERAVYLEHIRQQADALRAAALAVDPGTPVPTCPGWTAHKLLAHMARVHAFALANLRTDPADPPPQFPSAPRPLDELLPWWQRRLDELLAELADGEPDRLCYGLGRRIQPARFWARRQAHETAIHRLDAEHTRVGSDAAGALPTLVFDGVLAADGIDEALVLLADRGTDWAASEVSADLLLHAADVGRAWQVRLRSGRPPEVGPADATGQAAGMAADATVAGTADALYRAVWGRPSTAVTSGDRAALGVLTGG